MHLLEGGVILIPQKEFYQKTEETRSREDPTVKRHQGKSYLSRRMGYTQRGAQLISM